MSTLRAIILCDKYGLEDWEIDNAVSKDDVATILSSLLLGHLVAMEDWPKIFPKKSNPFAFYHSLCVLCVPSCSTWDDPDRSV